MAQAPLSEISSPFQSLAQKRGYDYDLVIVGGGIIGLTLAAALNDSGLNYF